MIGLDFMQFLSNAPYQIFFWGGILLIIFSLVFWWRQSASGKKDLAFRRQIAQIAADSGWHYKDKGEEGWTLDGKLGEHPCQIIRKQGNQGEAGARVILKLPQFKIKQDRFMLLSIATRKVWTNALLNGMIQSMAGLLNKRMPGADKVIVDMMTFAKDGLPAGELKPNIAKKWSLLTKTPIGQYLVLSEETQTLIMEFNENALRMEWGLAGMIWMYDIVELTGQDLEKLQSLAKSFAQDSNSIISRLR